MSQLYINYRPFNPWANEIRLLRLKPLKHNRDNRFDDHHVICELEHVDRTECVEYTALSYAWQDGREEQQITIANNMQNVSANLAAAIQELRDETNDVLLWIDQLCINQTNDAEKAQQVQEMKSIYERASQVVVWIGRRADNSDLVMTTFSEVAKYTRNPTKGGSILADISWRLAGCSPANPLEQPWNRQKILSCLPAAFDCFCKRGYWKRLWVIQEFAVARDLTIICGNHKVSFDTFDTAWWYLYYYPERVGNIETDSSVTEILEIAKACKSSAESFVSGIVTRRRRYQAGQGEKQDPLFSVMIINLTLEADYNQP